MELSETMVQGAEILSNIQMVVDVEPLHFVADADAVYLEPLTTSDWELVEVFAQELESGLLLRQVTIVYPNQVVSLAVGSDLVHLRVLEKSFPSKDCNNTDEICLRLVAESEVIISPKPRTQPREKFSGTSDEPTSYLPSIPIQVVPTEADFSMDMRKVFGQIHRHDNVSSLLIPCPPLLSVCIHPDTLTLRLDGWKDVDLQDHECVYALVEKSQVSRRNIFSQEQSNLHVVSIAKISTSEIVPLDSVGKIIL